MLIADRNEVLQETQLLDSAPEAAFDRLTRLAGGLLGAQTALVSLVDQQRQFFKSAWNLAEPWASRRETPLSHSFCQYVSRDRAPLIVEDAREHPVLKSNLAVTELGVVAYAGMPLMVSGQAIGALCVVDDHPRDWSADQLAVLRDLADSVVSEIELRAALRAAEHQRAMTEALVDSMGDVVLAIDPKRNFLIVNEAARRIFKRAEVGRPLPTDWTKEHRSRRPDGSVLPADEGALVRGLAGRNTDGLTFTLQEPGVKQPVWLEATGRAVRDATGKVVAAVAVYRDVTERTRQVDRYRALAGNIPGGVVALFDDDLRCLAVDGVLVRQTGTDPRTMIGLPMRTVAGLDRGAEFDAAFDRVEAVYRRTLAGEALTHDFADNGRIIALHTAPVRDELGRIAAGLVLGMDATETRRVEAALRRSEQIHRAMVKHLPNGAMLMLDRELRFVAADGPILADVMRAANLTGIVGRTVHEVSAAENLDALLDAYRGTLQGDRRHLELVRDDRFLDLRTVPIFDGGIVTHVLVFLHDVTEQRREAEELRWMRDQLVSERSLFEATLAHIEDGVALLGADRRLLLANTAFASMFGLAQDALTGLSPEQLMSHVTSMIEDPAEVRDRFLTEAPAQTDEFVFTQPRRRVLRRTTGTVKLPTQECYLVTWHDVTSDKALLAERDQQLMVDALTGVPNRRAALAALKVEHGRMRRSGAAFCVAVFDIDHFKRVNDELGHATGDRVLCQVAGAIAAEARVTDTVARWGGEEFIAVLAGPLGGARAFCERARVAVSELVCPEAGRVTVSVGVAEVGVAEDPSDALARADQLLYAAKRGGRNRVMP